MEKKMQKADQIFLFIFYTSLSNTETKSMVLWKSALNKSKKNYCHLALNFLSQGFLGPALELAKPFHSLSWAIFECSDNFGWVAFRQEISSVIWEYFCNDACLCIQKWIYLQDSTDIKQI